jgi:hypothetical protein
VIFCNRNNSDKMKIALFKYDSIKWESHFENSSQEEDTQIVLCFGDKKILASLDIYNTVRAKFPFAKIVFSSTAGQIFNLQVLDSVMIAVAFSMEHTPIKAAKVSIDDYESSYSAGYELIQKLPKEGLSYLFIISDGHKINGSELVKGINSVVADNVVVSGGLAGDGAEFNSTLTGLDENPTEGIVVALGFYGDQFIVSSGTGGGWSNFGPERVVTKSTGNRLYEINNMNALELYKKYLGPEAKRLPGSALLFPLAILIDGSEYPLVRTILSINEKEGYMQFAGDIPEGSKVRLMRANFDNLIEAASKAASRSINKVIKAPDFCLIVSCVGRKLVLGGRIDEEIVAVDDLLAHKTPIAGFYSYGEISPFNNESNCRLHNQSISITCFYEL